MRNCSIALFIPLLELLLFMSQPFYFLHTSYFLVFGIPAWSHIYCVILSADDNALDMKAATWPNLKNEIKLNDANFITLDLYIFENDCWFIYVYAYKFLSTAIKNGNSTNFADSNKVVCDRIMCVIARSHSFWANEYFSILVTQSSHILFINIIYIVPSLPIR